MSWDLKQWDMFRLLFWHWEAPVFGLVEGLLGGGCKSCSMCADICTCGWGLCCWITAERQTKNSVVYLAYKGEMSQLTPRKQWNECKESLSSWLNYIYFLQWQFPKVSRPPASWWQQGHSGHLCSTKKEEDSETQKEDRWKYRSGDSQLTRHPK